MNSKILTCAIATALLAGSVTLPAHADQAATDARLAELSAQIEALRTEVATLRAAQSSAPVATPAPGEYPTPATSPAAAGAGPAMAAEPAATREPSAVTFSGYGEIVYSRPSDTPEDAQADVRRVVLGVGYQFDERTRLEVEAEWEHAVTSADDEGEAAIEQVYISHELGHDLHVQAGLFLIPMGIINERHEPPVFYGVDRPLVETAIIPTTWREGGVAVGGNTSIGLQWSAGVTTGFDLTAWDPTSTDGLESPLASIHQEMMLAKAADLSVFGAVKYTGVPGLALGASVFTGGAAQDSPDNFPADDARVTVWSGYARWAPADWELTALYAEGRISDTADLNLTFIGNPVLVPERFWGAYGQVAYRGWGIGSTRIEPFLRYEQVNTGADYASIGTGLTPQSLRTVDATTFGATVRIHENVVFKLDYQDFQNADLTPGLADRFNLGLGYMY
jgi:outer membrane murein-binding lipoprotein Lpp